MKMNLRFAIMCSVVLCNISHGFAAEDIVAFLLMPDTVIQGEPLPITVQIKNVAQESRQVLVPVIRRFGPDTVAFSVQAPSDKQKRSVQRPDIYVGGLKMKSPGTLMVRRLSPGESVEYSFTLIYDFQDAETRRYLFKAPGRYTLQATVFELVDAPRNVKEVPYDVSRRALETDVVTVDVIPPESKREKEALHAMWGLPDEYLIYDPSAFRADCHAESAAKMREYFSSYSDTELGRRAALPLGMAVAEGVINDDSGAIRKALESLANSGQVSLKTMASKVLENMKSRGRQ